MTKTTIEWCDETWNPLRGPAREGVPPCPTGQQHAQQRPEGQGMTGRHVVVGEDCFRCLNCGEVHKVTMPISVDLFVKKCEAYLVLHVDCPKGAA